MLYNVSATPVIVESNRSFLDDLWGFTSSQPIIGDTATQQSPTLYSTITGRDYASGTESTNPSIGGAISDTIAKPVKTLAIIIVPLALIYLAYKFIPSRKK